jgi:hypothetical protein
MKVPPLTDNFYNFITYKKLNEQYVQLDVECKCSFGSIHTVQLQKKSCNTYFLYTSTCYSFIFTGTLGGMEVFSHLFSSVQSNLLSTVQYLRMKLIIELLE